MFYSAPDNKFNNSAACIKSIEEQRDKAESLGDKIYDGEFSRTVACALLWDTKGLTEAESYLVEEFKNLIEKYERVLRENLKLQEDSLRIGRRPYRNK